MGLKLEDAITRVDVDILFAYANGNLSVSEAARTARYDRKTISYHLDRVHMATGLDPRNFWDLSKLMKLLGVEERSGANR